MVDNIKIFKERFRELKSRYKTYESMSEDVKITRQTIGTYYNGKSLPNGENIIKICNAFNVTSDWLLGLSDVNTKDETTTNIMDKASILKEAMASAIKSICEDVIRTSNEEENTKRANAIKSLSEAYYIITGVNQNDKN